MNDYKINEIPALYTKHIGLSNSAKKCYNYDKEFLVRDTFHGKIAIDYGASIEWIKTHYTLLRNHEEEYRIIFKITCSVGTTWQLAQVLKPTKIKRTWHKATIGQGKDMKETHPTDKKQ